MSCIEKFKLLSKCNTVGVSKFVNVKEFKNDFNCLKLGNGGSWCRFDRKLGKKYKLISVKENGKIRFSWKPTDIEKIVIEKHTMFYMKENQILKKKGIKIKLLKLCGLQEQSSNRPIGRRIRNFFKNKPCVSCGSNSNLEIDHKNGLYNDNEVLNIKTQKIEHFQVLCKHCNDQKRQTLIYTKKTNKRYPATKIPMLSIFNIQFTTGDENYDPNDKDWGIGTYWNDPIDFMKNIKLNLSRFP